MKLTFVLFACLAFSLFARLEWPGDATEGQPCNPRLLEGFQCQVGLVCVPQNNREDAEGFCRKSCVQDSDCHPEQYCNLDTSHGFCWDV